MLSPEDIAKKQILLITTFEDDVSSIQLKNSNIFVTGRDGKVRQMSLYRLLAVFILGEFTITSNILQQLKNFGISTYFLKQNCLCWGAVESYSEGNYLVRGRQYKITDQEEFEIAQILIYQKVINQQLLLREGKAALPDFRLTKSDVQKNIKKIKNKKALLGVEGTYSKTYFQKYFKDQNWLGRKPQVKQDITNLLMDIGYTYLFNLITAYLKLFGFDVYKGVYHTLFFERKSLACDLMEPFRPLIDKQIKKAYNLKQIDEKDFGSKNGIYSLSWKKQSKYSQIFLETLVDNKSQIFLYIRQYYRYFMRPDKYKFPTFKIK
jgi:CRISPR-associated protein Cas1